MPELQLVSELAGHHDPAWRVAFNPQRNLLASCSTDRTVRLFSYANDKFELVSSIPTGHKRTVRALAWSPSGSTFATASFDSTVSIWEEEDGDWECVTTLEGHENEAKDVGWSAEGGLLASVSRDRSCWVWELLPDQDFECIAVQMDHTADVKAVAWHPKEEVREQVMGECRSGVDERARRNVRGVEREVERTALLVSSIGPCIADLTLILASASYDSHIHLMFDDPDGDWGLYQKLRPRLPGTNAPIIPALSLTPEEAEGAELEVPPLEEPETVWALAWSPCGGYLASSGDRGGIRLWKKEPGFPGEMREVAHVVGHRGPVYSISWGVGVGSGANESSETEDLGLLASGGGDGRIVIWQASEAGFTPVAGMRSAHGVADVNSVAWNPRVPGMLASAGDDGGLKVWRVAE